MSTVTWLHLSDWHQHGKEFDRQLVCDKLLEDIRSCRQGFAELATIDLIFFTGDLAYHGKAEEYKAAQEQLLVPVLDATDQTKERLFVIPGNHDFDRSILNEYEAEFRRVPQNRDALQAMLAEGRPRHRTLDPFFDYQKWFDDYKPAGFGAYAGSGTVTVNGQDIGIIGCNSALMCGRNFDAEKKVQDYGYLAVSNLQIHDSLIKIANAPLRIGLIHHPFEWLRDFDRQEVETEFRSECHFILRGHEHSNRIDVVNGTGGTGVIIRGGACYSGFIPERPIFANAYNFVHYDIESQTGAIYFRRWSDEQNRWVPDYEKGERGRVPFALPTVSSAPSIAATVSDTSAADLGKLSVIEQKIADEQLRVVRQEYLRFISQRWVNLELRGIMQTAKTDAIPLDEVYVALTAECEIKELPRFEQIDIEDDSRSLGSEVSEVALHKTASDMLRQLNKAPWFSQEQMEKIDLPRALRDNAHVVVLGDPGAGKTTLARFLARQFALAVRDDKSRVLITPASLPINEAPSAKPAIPDDYGPSRLPILLRVADYAEALRHNGNLRLRDFLYHARAEADISEAEAKLLFEDTLVRGKALVILDGLDEVAQNADRAAIARHIDDFTYGLGATNRVLVTSRIAGYPQSQLGAKFALFTIRDMEYEQIERFVTRRVMAYERAQTDGGANQAIQQRAQQDIAGILNAVKNNDGVKRLAVNPLLLAILCLIHRTGARLPERRVELYAIASKTLLEDWRPAQTEQKDRALTLSEADRLLAPLADWMHENVESGLIREGKARDLLHEFCASRYGLPKNHPIVESEVDKFWQKITYDTSVFVERSQDEYAFLHLTFEEYWAARYLVRDFTLAPERIQFRRHSPRFAEVILLSIASQTEENASHLIMNAIWSPQSPTIKSDYIPSPYEDVLHRDLLLAARCCVDCTDIEPALARNIAIELVSICISASVPGPVSPLLLRVYELLGEFRKRAVGFEAVQLLLPILKAENPATRSAAAEALGRVGQGSLEVVQTLLTTLKDESDNVRFTATRALGRVGSDSPEVAHALLVALKDESDNVRSAVAEALGTTGKGSPEVIHALLIAFKDKSATVRSAAAEALSTVGKGSPEVIHALLVALKDKSVMVRSAVARALGTTEKGSPEVIHALLIAFKDKSATVRSAVAEALGTVGKGSPEAVRALLAALKDENPYIYSTTEESLVKVGQGSPEVVQALLVALKDESDNVRSAVAEVLGRVGQGSPEVVHALLVALKDKDIYVRSAATRSLGRVGQGSPEVVQVLLVTLKKKSVTMCSAAVRALSTAGQGSPEVVQALLAALKKKSITVRSAVVEAIGILGEDSLEVVQVLLNTLKDENAYMRYVAAEALGIAGKGSTETVQALLMVLKDKETYVRSAAWESLSSLVVI